MTKYELECPHCKNRQIYQPRGKIPKKPHTNCKKCGNDFKFQNPNETVVKIENKSKVSKQPEFKISPGMKITKESLEPLIATAIKENPSNIQILRLAVDFCKINESEEEVGEIDMNKFLKILEE